MKYLLLLCALAPVASGQSTIFGSNSGTFADYLPTLGMNALPLRAFGTASDIFNPHPEVLGPNGSIIANFGSVSYAKGFPSGTYVFQFDSPAPVTIAMAGIFAAPSNVQRVGTHTTMNIQLTHDNGDVQAGLGWFTGNGVSASNPVSNLTFSGAGKNPADLTPTFAGYAGKYQAIRWMSNLEINNNTALRTSANLVPSGYNAGLNSYDDIIRWSNQQASLKKVMIEIPVNADDSFIKAVADKFNAGLAPGKQVIVEHTSEGWNAGFQQFFYLLNRAKTDANITATDDFGKAAQEYGLMAYHTASVFENEFSDKTRVEGFLGSQASNTYWVDSAKAIIKAKYGANAVKSVFKWQGPGYYPGDNLTSASSVDDLFAKMYADFPRMDGYLVTDRNDAAADGLQSLCYEAGWSGYLTHGGVSQSIIDGFRADPRSKQWVLDEWSHLKNDLNNSGIVMTFDILADGWSPQIIPWGPTEFQQQGVDAISASVLVPEPSVFSLWFAGLFLLRRRSQPRKRR